MILNMNLNADLDNEGEQHAVADVEGPAVAGKINPGKDNPVIVATVNGIVNQTITFDPITGIRTLVIDRTGIIYNIWDGEKNTIATGMDIPKVADSNDALNDPNYITRGTPVILKMENGKWTFRLLTPIQPEINTDPSGQLLDDPSITEQDDGTDQSGGGVF